MTINNMTSGWARSPRWAYCLCLCLVLVSLAMFGFTLDRYPRFYTEELSDESWFNTSAVRYQEGRTFAYAKHSETPHRETVSAMHGPFYSRMQVFTLRLLGVSHFSCRLPSYFAAHLGVLLICLFLLRSGSHLSAIAVSLAWVGDRSMLAVMKGRPDGVAFLCVAAGFVCLLNAIYYSRKRDGAEMCRRSNLMIGAGAMLAIAIGFHPGTIIFVGLSGVMVLLFVPCKQWFWTAISLALGAMVPTGLFLLCWSVPDLAQSMEQFLWLPMRNASNYVWHGWPSILARWPTGNWARNWCLVSIALTMFVLAPLVVLEFVRRLRGKHCDPNRIGAVGAALFAIGGLIMYLKSSFMSPYYLVFFSVWPVVSFSLLCETSSTGKWLRRLAGVSLVLLMFVWLQSAAWNVMRSREAWLWYKSLDRTEMIKIFSEHIPDGADVTGQPAYFVVAHEAGVKFTPLSWYVDDTGMAVHPDAWLIIGAKYTAALETAGKSRLLLRPLVYRGIVIGEPPYAKHEVFIYGPEKTGDGVDRKDPS